MKVNLFTYGTLCLPEVMQSVAGRVFATATARLDGYLCRLLRRRVYPGMIRSTNDSTQGLLHYDVDAQSLARIDAFEGGYYRRESVLAVREDGGEVAACTYVLVESLHHLLSDSDWDEEEFRRKHLQHYLRCEG
jgi:gamma-glutamylcyclotransferase (GGCT)/AIG2-like uncharacterized protein YtfP